MISRRVDYILPIAVSMLYFLTFKQAVPTYVFLIIVIPISLYYFPVKLLLFNKSSGGSDAKSKIFMAVSNLLFSIILSLSIVHLYLQDSVKLETIIAIFALVDFIASIYYFVTEKNSNNFITHYCFFILAVGIKFIS